MKLFLNRSVSVARGLVHFHNGCADILLTNFGDEFQHIARTTTVAFFHDFSETAKLCSIELSSAAVPRSRDIREVIAVSPNLSVLQKQHLHSLLQDFAECFCSCAQVQHMTIAKHRVITEETIRPVCQHPHQVPLKERDYQEPRMRNARRRCQSAFQQSVGISRRACQEERQHTAVLCRLAQIQQCD